MVKKTFEMSICAYIQRKPNYIDKMKPKTWKKISKEKKKDIKDFLLSLGGMEDKNIKGPNEEWRIKVNDKVFTFYTKGTLFVNRVEEDLAVQISKILGQEIKKSEKEILIGLDETGKGEVLGHCILCGICLPSLLIKELDYLLGSADTKRKRTVSYWDALFQEIDKLNRKGLKIFKEKIPPWHVDKYNINKIMDVVYQRILGNIVRETSPDNCRIVIDDYGVGANLSKYLDFLSKKGSQIVVETKADEKYLECRLASIIAKWEREKVMEAISKKFSLPKYPIGSGNAGDSTTIAWIENWRGSGKPWPWFVKQSFRTIGKRVIKTDPPIRHELLFKESKSLFEEGKLSVESLRVICPKCGSVLKSCKITPSENEHLLGRCSNPECKDVINDLNTTLLYYCGYIIPDSSVIISGIISKDLEKFKFFEGFTFVLLPEVRRECDTRGGKKELGRLGDFASMGRINLTDIDTEEIIKGKDLTTDETIVEVAKRINSLVYTRDRGMFGTAVSKKVFCLSK